MLDMGGPQKEKSRDFKNPDSKSIQHLRSVKRASELAAFSVPEQAVAGVW
jgi:hypothetical protein